MKKTILLLIVVLLIPQISDAAMLGVNRVAVNFDDVLRNGYAEEQIIISTAEQRNISVSYEARGEIAEWIRFEPVKQPININNQEPGRLRIIVEPPADARVDEYEGRVVLTTGELGNVSGNVGANVKVAFEVKINIQITDTQVLRCSAGGINIADAEIGKPFPFTATVNNNGNVRIKPTMLIEVMDKEMEEEIELLSYSYKEDIRPTTSLRVEDELQNELETGQYWALVSAPDCGGESLVTFSVLEKGGISDQGEFVRIENKPWAETEETVPISITFRNRGERTVTAQFKGAVMNGDRVVRLINSDELEVDPDELTEFQVYFSSEYEGQYRIVGRVHYNNKITYEKGTILNVKKGTISETQNSFDYSLFLTIIIVVAGILLFLILRQKTKKNKF